MRPMSFNLNLLFMTICPQWIFANTRNSSGSTAPCLLTMQIVRLRS
ncbi:hypothetical protein I352_01194 [Cryptococcus deuterogattii MMRL2647]|nr:hypothetical protein I352_01194 [Cryptococcus deuterogattii MMRL2647]